MHDLRRGTSAFGIVLLALLGTLVSGTAGARAARAASAAVTFQIKVPRPAARKPAAGAPRAHPLYISASTKSFVVLTDGANPVVAGVDPATGLARVRIIVDVGTHTFRVTAYDRAAGQGNVLSSGTTAPVFVPAAGAVVRLTLDGVAATVKLQLEQTRATIGLPANIYLDVLALDADGNTILQGTRFTQPFTLTSSNPVDGKLSQTVITTAVIDDHSYDHPISVAYDGANVAQIVFSAAGSGLAAVTPTVLVPLKSPAAGRQLIVTGVPTAAFSTSGVLQLLTTFNTTPPESIGLGAAAADDVTGLLYQAAYYEVTTPTGSLRRSGLAVYQTTGSHALVAFFQPPVDASGVAVDSAAKKLYISDLFSQDVKILSTSGGHPVLGTIATGLGGATGPDLAIDPRAGRLFVSEDGSGGGVKAFSTTPPFADLGYLATDSHGAAAVDPVAGRLYVADFENDFSNGFIAVYGTSTLALLAKIGPFPYPTIPLGVAVDPSTQHLFVAFPVAKQLPFDDTSPADTVVAVYGLGSELSFPLLGTFTTAGNGLVVAPFTP